MNTKNKINFAIVILVLLAIACGTTPPPAPTNTPLPPTLTPVPPAPLPTKPAPSATPTNTPAAITLAGPTDTPNATNTVEPNILPTEEPVVVPSSFTLTLIFDDDTTCGFEGFEFDYAVTLDETTITLVQIVNSLTSTGPYDPVTGAFTAIVSGLPGTETYTGTITASAAPDGGTVIRIEDGLYTYADDPATCQGFWPFTGRTTLP